MLRHFVSDLDVSTAEQHAILTMAHDMKRKPRSLINFSVLLISGLSNVVFLEQTTYSFLSTCDVWI